MGADENTRVRDIMDRLVREKDIAACYFVRVAESLEEVERRRWFRRMGQDEKDQRKILVKHRKEICGIDRESAASVEVSPIHERLDRSCRNGEIGFVDALRLAAAGAEQCRRFSSAASDLVGDRSCRIFLKILSGESAVLRQELVTELRAAERQQPGSVEELAA